MAEDKTEVVLGFVCPAWAKSVWNQNECSVETATNGTFAVVDHSLQITVYVGTTREECENWLGTPYRVSDWLTECAQEACILDLCPRCGEPYFFEDGTSCDCTQSTSSGAPKDSGLVTCHRHGKPVFYWHEDYCPDCVREEEEIS
jgi:hypothetical protein